MPYTFDALAPEYARTWRSMAIRPECKASFDSVARRLYANRARYQAVEDATGVPLSVIAVIHEREASGSFWCHLHNGDSLNARTIHVPSGRPRLGHPPFTWQESAIDAMQYDGLDQITDWTVERALFRLELFNGVGYRNRGLRSPYLWAGSDQQQPGKYVADGKFDASAMDQQLGAAGLLYTLWVMDPALRLPMLGETRPQPDEHPAPLPPVIPVPPDVHQPDDPGVPSPPRAGFFISWLRRLFGW